MEKKPPKPPDRAGPATRSERLKAALKANLQRRKAQAKRRTGADPDGTGKG